MLIHLLESNEKMKTWGRISSSGNVTVLAREFTVLLPGQDTPGPPCPGSPLLPKGPRSAVHSVNKCSLSTPKEPKGAPKRRITWLRPRPPRALRVVGRGATHTHTHAHTHDYLRTATAGVVKYVMRREWGPDLV